MRCEKLFPAHVSHTKKNCKILNQGMTKVKICPFMLMLIHSIFFSPLKLFQFFLLLFMFMVRLKESVRRKSFYWLKKSLILLRISFLLTYTSNTHSFYDSSLKSCKDKLLKIYKANQVMQEGRTERRKKSCWKEKSKVRREKFMFDYQQVCSSTQLTALTAACSYTCFSNIIWFGHFEETVIHRN